MLDTQPDLPGEDHIASYYAASVPERAPCDRLEGEHACDVVIIGGGFTGIATALTLAERGYKVIVLEANRIGWGASGRNGGQLIGGMSGEQAFKRQLGKVGERFLRETYYRGNEIVRERAEKYHIDCDLKSGWMYVASKASHIGRVRSQAEEHAAAGHSVELLDRHEVSSMLSTDAYHGGYVDMASGHLHPLKLIRGEADAAVGLGVRIFERSEVLDIRHGRRARVVTARGAVESDFVVLAGGAYHELERRGLKGLLFPNGSYIIATEPLGEVADEINPRDLAICDSKLILDYYRLTGDRRMLYGGRCNYSNREPRDIAGALQPRMTDIYPQLAGKRIEFAWGGKIGIIINRIPAIGRLAPNVVYAQGYCGHGVNFSHLAGEILADVAGGTLERFDLFERIQHTRIPAPRWVGNQILALGMTYMRVRDML